MTCTERKNMTDGYAPYSSDKFVDEWGGYVEITKRMPETPIVLLNVYTPWGDKYLDQIFQPNSSKTFESGLKEYIVNVHDITYDSFIDAYVFGVSLCYEEFEEFECIPKWVCKLDVEGVNTGYMIDGCGNISYDIIQCPIGEKPTVDLLIPIVIGVGLLGLLMMRK